MRDSVTVLTLLVALVITTDDAGRLSLLPSPAHAATSVASDTSALPSQVSEITETSAVGVAVRRDAALGSPMLSAPIHRMISGDALLDAPAQIAFAADGGFDLIIHFHGGGAILAPQLEALGAPAALLSVNLGEGSSRYIGAFSDPNALWHLVDGVERTVQAQVPSAKVRRLALSAWSAGYGALQSLLTQARVVDRVDAVVLADGLHGSFADESARIIADVSLAPFVAFAERAARGDKLMLITHSSIDTYGYASTTESSRHVEAALGPTGGEKERPTGGEKERAEGATCEHVAPASMQLSRCWERGLLRIAAYAGNDKQAHADHLQQLGSLAFRSLFARWTPERS